ncbi:hydroxyethylthiazole kinase [bacterium]|nr:hydroxyethylthiazole kinase [bacterium]
MPDARTLCRDLCLVRERAPLVHNITNYVVMNSTANALLAIGASPVMAHALEEVAEMAAIAQALVINIGTLSPPWVASMQTAVRVAGIRGIPWVLDPVGAGATTLRTETARMLLADGRPTIVRGNGSEIMALQGAAAATKGVDSVHSGDDALDAARALASEYQCVVSVSGAVDAVTDGQVVVRVANGHALMPRVTGLGCTASALTGAFAAVDASPIEAAAHAMAVMGIAGELAAEKADGPGTLQLHFLDALYGLSDDDVASRLRMTVS